MKKLLVSLIISLGMSVAWANETFKIIVPNPVGSGAGDSVARKLAEIYNKRTNNNIIVVNVPGGNQILAMTAFKGEKQAATILTSSQLVYKTLPDDQLPYKDQDFFLLSDIGEVPNYYFTAGREGITSARSLVTILPNTSKPLIGYQSALTMINVRSIAQNGKVKIDGVGYKGVPEMMLNVLSGELLVGHGAIGGNAILEYVKQGKLQLIGSTSARPIKVGDITVPSVSQTLGVPQFNGHILLGVTPGVENTAIGRELLSIMQSQEMQEYLRSIYIYPVGGNMWTHINNMREQAAKHQNLFKQ